MGEDLQQSRGPRPDASSYWLTRFLLLRGMGFVYFVAFFSLAHQLLPLLGSEGLLPVSRLLELGPGHPGRWLEPRRRGRAVGGSLRRPARVPRLRPRFSSPEDGPVRGLHLALLPFIPL